MKEHKTKKQEMDEKDDMIKFKNQEVLLKDGSSGNRKHLKK